MMDKIHEWIAAVRSWWVVRVAKRNRAAWLAGLIPFAVYAVPQLTFLQAFIWACLLVVAVNVTGLITGSDAD